MQFSSQIKCPTEYVENHTGLGKICHFVSILHTYHPHLNASSIPLNVTTQIVPHTFSKKFPSGYAPFENQSLMEKPMNFCTVHTGSYLGCPVLTFFKDIYLILFQSLVNSFPHLF